MGGTMPKQKTVLMISLRRFQLNLVPSSGFEPETDGLENRCSIQLSYEGVCAKV